MRQLVDDLLGRQSSLRELVDDDRPAHERKYPCHSGRDCEQRYGISEETARKWKKHISVHDAFHTPHRL